MDGGDAKTLERLRREIVDLEAMDLLVSKRLSVARNERKAILARQRLATLHQDPEFLKKKMAGLKRRFDEPTFCEKHAEDNRRRALDRSPLKNLTPEQRIKYDGLISKHMTSAQALSVIYPKRLSGAATPLAVPVGSLSEPSPRISPPILMRGSNSGEAR